MRLFFQSVGQGAPVVILHGLFGSLDNWGGIARRLAANFRVISVDLRNHGRSPHSEEMNYAVMAGDVLELLEELGLKRAHVLGHSMGGKAAMELALEHPERIDRLVVVDMAPKAYPPHHVEVLRAMQSLRLEQYQERHEIEAALKGAIPEPAIRQFILKSVGREVGGGFHWKLNLEALARNQEALSGELRGNRVCERPALFLCGERSDYVLDADLCEIRKLFPCAELERVGGAAHWVHAEAPELFLQKAGAFLASP